MRVPGLDLLRGICALAVAIYHVLYWQDVAKFYTWGTYGVYVFFALSGASMVIAYAGRLSTSRAITAFMALRLARLLPLYVLTMLVGLLINYRHASLSDLPVGSVFLNTFFLFGAGNPGAVSRVVGGWSLGIEFVFYLMFPVFLALVMTRAWVLVLVVAFASQHVFVQSVLGNGKGLVLNWVPYTQFLSFIFYFLAGCVLGRFILEQKISVRRGGVVLLLLSLAVLGISSGNDAVQTLTGWTGWGLSIVAVLSVWAAACCDLKGFARPIAEALGRSSYGVYILHPIFYALSSKLMGKEFISGHYVLPLTILSSLLLALLLEKYFERPIQARAKRVFAGHFQRSVGAAPSPQNS